MAAAARTTTAMARPTQLQICWRGDATDENDENDGDRGGVGENCAELCLQFRPLPLAGYAFDFSCFLHNLRINNLLSLLLTLLSLSFFLFLHFFFIHFFSFFFWRRLDNLALLPRLPNGPPLLAYMCVHVRACCVCVVVVYGVCVRVASSTV